MVCEPEAHQQIPEGKNICGQACITATELPSKNWAGDDKHQRR